MMNSIAEVRKLAEADLERGIGRVAAAMRVRVARHLRPEDPLMAAFEHHLAAGGGQTRVRVALSASASLGLPDGDAFALASAVELLHNASLVQDDLQDESGYRRGRPAVWREFGRDTSIALTDLLISASFSSLAAVSCTSRLPELLETMHRAMTLVVRGQETDLKRGETAPSGVSDYVAVAQEKSGGLFALALELPLIAAGEASSVPAAHKAACWFGIGYQIYDDIRDLDADRRAGAVMNAVLVMETLGGRRAALTEARLLARGHLRSARALAETLPAGSGALLSVLSRRLERELGEQDHA
jgi:geranylgeranyl diphosphate synthase, type I